MNILSLKSLLLICQIYFITSSKVIEPIEDDNSKLLDTASSLETGLPESNGMTEDSSLNESLPEESRNVEATPAIVNGPNLFSKNDVITQIPMTCIKNYKEYCQSKFYDFKFKDGCHNCKCSTSNSNFCDTGPCKYFARSFEHAVVYCKEIMMQNQKDFEIQQKNRPNKKQNSFTKNNKKTNRKQNFKIVTPIKVVIQKKKNTKERKLQKFMLKKMNPQRRVKKKSHILQKTFKKSVILKLKPVGQKPVEKENVLDKIENENFFSDNFKDKNENVKKIIKVNKVITNSNSIPEIQKLNNIEKVKNTDSNNDTKLVVRTSLPVSNISEKYKKTKIKEKERNIVIEPKKMFENIAKSKTVQIGKLDRKDKIFSNNTTSSKVEQKAKIVNIIKKNSINTGLKDRGKVIRDKVHPIQKSLEKLSGQKQLKKIIYTIAYNELSIKRILKKMKKEPHEGKTAKLFDKRLRVIQTENSMFKSKILEIVKTKLKLSKSNYGPFDHKFDKMFLVKISKKLNRLNEELHDMKGGVKMWARTYKNVLHGKESYSKHGLELKISSLIIIFCVIFSMI